MLHLTTQNFLSGVLLHLDIHPDIHYCMLAFNLDNVAGYLYQPLEMPVFTGISPEMYCSFKGTISVDVPVFRSRP